MNVVVLGSRERMLFADQARVRELLYSLRERYSSMVVLSAGCDKGIGQLVKGLCTKEKDSEGGRHHFQFIEFSVLVFADVPRTRMGKIYEERNRALMRSGDEFHVFVSANRKDTLEEFVVEAVETGRPVFVYKVDGTVERVLPLADTGGNRDAVRV